MRGLNRELIGEIVIALLVLSSYIYYQPLCTTLLDKFIPPLAYTLCSDDFALVIPTIISLVWAVRTIRKIQARRGP